MPSTDIPPPSEVLLLIRQELTVNKEASDLRELLAGKREQLQKLVAAETLPDKLGLTRVPFAIKKTPQEALKDEVAQIAETIRAKAVEWKSLKAKIESQLEDFLLRVDFGFSRVCRTFGIISECRAIIVNLRNRTTDYLPRLGQLRGALSSGYNLHTQSYSPTTIELVTAASQAGLVVDAAVFKLQEREHQMAEILENSLANRVPFPEIIPLNLGDLTESLKSRNLDDAHRTIQQILSYCEAAIEKQCPAYEQGLTDAEDGIRAACLAYIDAYWQTTRQQLWHKLHQADPMPRRRSMTKTTAPFHPPLVPGSVTRPALATGGSSEDDTGKGLTNDFYVRSEVRRSSLKLRK